MTRLLMLRQSLTQAGTTMVAGTTMGMVVVVGIMVGVGMEAMGWQWA